MIRNDGGPAFPIMDAQTVHRIGAQACEGLTDPDERDKAYLAAVASAASGMSLRAHFAGIALAALIQKWDGDEGRKAKPVLCKAAWAFADAMLLEGAQ